MFFELLEIYRHYLKGSKTALAGGRKSGRTFSLSVVIALVEGPRYLVSMLGDDAQWTQNVRATGGKAVLRSGSREEVQLDEVPLTSVHPS